MADPFALNIRATDVNRLSILHVLTNYFLNSSSLKGDIILSDYENLKCEYDLYEGNHKIRDINEGRIKNSYSVEDFPSVISVVNDSISLCAQLKLIKRLQTVIADHNDTRLHEFMTNHSVFNEPSVFKTQKMLNELLIVLKCMTAATNKFHDTVGKNRGFYLKLVSLLQANQTSHIKNFSELDKLLGSIAKDVPAKHSKLKP